MVTEFATHTYFVADTGRTNSTRARRSWHCIASTAPARELVDGVEDLQIEYALDTDGNGTIDAFAGTRAV